MLRSQDGHAERIVVYSGSEVFRCASRLNQIDCPLKLASTIIHEAWHYKHGPQEAGAYDAQITFLIMRGASIAQIEGVTLARDRILAARRAAERRRQLARLKGLPFEGDARSED